MFTLQPLYKQEYPLSQWISLEFSHELLRMQDQRDDFTSIPAFRDLDTVILFWWLHLQQQPEQPDTNLSFWDKPGTLVTESIKMQKVKGT